MESTLLPLKLPPGIYRNGTPYQAAGRWYDANGVRFIDGTIRPIGGWVRAQASDNTDLAALTGVPRAALAWSADDGSPQIVFATTEALTLLAGGEVHDLTPSGFTDGSADAAPAAGGSYGDGAFGSGLYGQGSLQAAIVDLDTWQLDAFGAFLVAVCTSDEKLYVWQGDPAVAAAVPTWGPTFTGSLVTNAAASAGDSSIALTASTLTGTIFAGQTFVIGTTTFTATDDATASGNVLTVNVSPVVPTGGILSGAAVSGTDAQAPSCRAAVVTPERFLVALGAEGVARRVAWASQETISVWGATDTNTAGDFDLATNGRLVAGRRARGTTLLWTDVDLWMMSYIGGTLVYRFDQAGDKCGLVAPNAVAMIDTQAVWMGLNSFFVFDGFVRPIPCEVNDAVFSNFNTLQKSKVWCLPIAEFGEVWWFYPSATSQEVDKYVVYNYRENHWSTGTLSRTAGIPRGAVSTPIMVTADGLIYQHESGTTRSGMTPFLESGPIELGAGDQVMKILRIVPDEKNNGDTSLKFITSMFPGDAETTNGPYTSLEPTSVRLTARKARLRFDEVNAVDWRIGNVRLGIKPGGRR